METLQNIVQQLLKIYPARDIIAEIKKQGRKAYTNTVNGSFNYSLQGVDIDQKSVDKILEVLKQKSVGEAVLQKIQERNFTFDVRSTRCRKCKKCTNGGSCSFFQRVRVPKHSTAYTIPKSIKIETAKQT